MDIDNEDNESKIKTQAACNHQHMSFVLDGNFYNHNYSSPDYEFVADLYEALLKYSLNKKIPQLEFVVDRYEEEDRDITITFYQPN